MTVDSTLVLAGHGSHVSPASSDPLFAHADRLSDASAFDEVLVAVWQGEPHLRTALRRARADRITVVPVMMAGGYFTDQVFPRELRLTGGEPVDAAKSVRYTAPVGSHPALADVIVRRAETALDGTVSRGDVSLALVGHGTPLHQASGVSTRDHAQRLRARDRFEEVRPYYLDQDPKVHGLTARMATDDIVVVPLFVSDGPHAREDIPRAIGLPTDPAGPTDIDGHRVWYTGAIGTDPTLATVIKDLAGSGHVRKTDRGSNERGDATAAIEAFGRWMAAQPGGRGWGELLLAAGEAAPGPSKYSVRHRRDAGIPTSQLERIETLRGLRETVRYDNEGRYRPFAGAKTLPSGWVRTVTSLQALYRTVDIVYPGSVVDWYREGTGDFDSLDFETVADRHTGRYDDLGSIPQSDREATITACCGDCSRRPVWTTGGGQESAIPCREPCSFLLAAMTTFNSLDTHREAATDDGGDGDLDHPANRYRTRYRRARTDHLAPTPGDGP